MVAAQAPTPLVEASGMTKVFGARAVLSDVDLTIKPGEIHGLVGQNGSGKSTLIKILAGYHAPEDGAKLSVRGESVDLPLSPGSLRELGFSFVHQDLALADTQTV